ncbi:AfsR/SARP family transcriptional regulator [Modestobacter excelsi]|uniref:AfsR/SARP family transcriptional regulator n=1 Tax=Modestobacter excelsi TaxID=2213161 RepID=UPI00110D02BD|nr:BTAD domain-containing putative transcriptional regulator [Modestobacter excelsi]
MDGSAEARVELLDGFSLERGRGGVYTAVEGLPQGAQRLIAHLGLCGRPTRAAVAGELWPDVPEDHAHGSLRSALWRVQKVVPGLVSASGGALGLANGVRVDVWDFKEWAQRALDPTADVDGTMAPRSALAAELLPGWYDDWVLLERERLRQLRLHALEMLADKLARAGRHGEAVQAACAAVHAEPLRESAHRALIRVHLAEGNAAEAVRAYQCFRDLLAHELGVAPTEHMEELMSRAHLGALGPRRPVPD